MTEIKVLDDTLLIEPAGWAKLWSFKRQLSIPLAHVKNVRAETVDIGWGMCGIRLLGTFVPFMYAAGTYYNGGYEFWDVQHPDKVIVIDLENDGWKRLVVEVSDPALAVEAIQHAVAATQAA